MNPFITGQIQDNFSVKELNLKGTLTFFSSFICGYFLNMQQWFQYKYSKHFLKILVKNELSWKDKFFKFFCFKIISLKT